MRNDYLTLILTLKCNESCDFCFIDKKNVSLKEKDALETVEFFLNSSGEEKTIKFFGGEPLLEFGLLKNIVHFCERKVKNNNKRLNFVLSSTGTLLNNNILDFIKLHQIELVLDSLHLGKIKKNIFKKLFPYPFLTLTINITPNSVKRLFKEFNKFYDLGFRRFNILPIYYISWSRESKNSLEKGLGKIKYFYQEHPEIYFKNSDLGGVVPLFNSCLTCDVTGDIYSSNIILFKNLSKFKKDFYLGHIREFNFKKDLVFDNGRLPKVINKAFPKKILIDTFAIDKILSTFVSSLKGTIKIADIKLGNRCNNLCKFCVRRKKGEEALGKSTKEIMNDLVTARRDCQGVVLTGGEVSIREDFFELISYAKRLGFRMIQVQTNGRMFAYKHFCHKAIKAGANEFQVAVHGHIPELHDYLTSSSGSFLQTVRAIKNLKELNQVVVTNTVIVKSSYRHLHQIAQLLVNLGVDQFQFAFVHALGQAAENFESVVPRMSMVMPYVKRGLDIGMNAGIKVMTEAIPYCLMAGYEDCIAEKIIPHTKIFEFSKKPGEDYTTKVIDFDKIRPEEAKAKGKDCRRCRYHSVCEGTWREYPERFGWSEFRPVI